MKNLNIKLLVVLLLALVLRASALDKFPPGLTWDEAAIGYNAYSILSTARDEHNQFLPLVFKSFGDYKPGLYIYLTVPFVAVLGLNEVSTRLPSAILGTLSVFLLYLIVKKFQPKAAIWVAFALAIQPFHIIFSRGAWETNLATTLYLSAIYFFQRFLGGKSLWPSAIAASLSLLAYQGAKMVVPLLLVSQVIIFKDEFKQRLDKPGLVSTKNILPLIFGIIIALLVYLPSIFGSAGGRLAAKSYFSYIRPDSYINHLKQLDPNPTVYQLFHNLRFEQFRDIVYRYTNHFSPRLLFYEGDWQTHFAQIPNMGLLYGIDFLFIALGIYYLANQGKNKFNLLWLSLLVIAPLPAAPTLDAVSSIRAQLITIPFAILIGSGMTHLISQRHIIARLFTAAAFTVLCLHFALALDGYTTHLPKQNYRSWLYGYRQVVEQLEEYPNHDVVFTHRLGQPYIFYLFYTKYSPEIYKQQEHLIQTGPDVGYVDRLDMIQFKAFNFLYDNLQPNTIYVALPEDLDTSTIPPEKGTLLSEIKSPDGNVFYRILKTNP